MIVINVKHYDKKRHGLTVPEYRRGDQPEPAGTACLANPGGRAAEDQSAQNFCSGKLSARWFFSGAADALPERIRLRR